MEKNWKVTIRKTVVSYSESTLGGPSKGVVSRLAESVDKGTLSFEGDEVIYDVVDCTPESTPEVAWTDTFGHLAESEGWCLSARTDDSPPYEIQKVDELEIFKSDDDAIEFVVLLAKMGKDHALSALAFIREKSEQESNYVQKVWKRRRGEDLTWPIS